ncbi:MAG: GMC family oxidoreductase [Solirubrobacteraceae bacterium]
MGSPQDADWIVIGSGFGGSVAALRLAEKGYGVTVLECGRRFLDDDFARSTWDARRYFWAPRLGCRGILRLTLFRDVFIASGCGVGGGSLGYANTLYRARDAFFADERWSALADWKAELAPHYDTAERMLGVTDVAFDSDKDRLLRELADDLGVADTYSHTRVGVFFGEEGATVPDPYFGGDGPARTGCIRCGECMVGCRHGAKNTLVKNYLWFAERLGVRVEAERTVTDIRPAGAPDGSDGYLVTSERSGAWLRKRRRTQWARGVVVAAGALGTNLLLANCRHRGSLPLISGRLGQLVRTNSESVVAATAPDDRVDFTGSVAISSSIYPDPDTHIELVTYGGGGGAMRGLYTTLVGDGTRVTRPLRWLAANLRRPGQFVRTLTARKWSRRTVLVLVMQTVDSALRFRAAPRRTGPGVKLATEQDPENPNPTFIPAANHAARWLADRIGGMPQSGLTEALFNVPVTAHILGGATIGADREHGVIGADGQVHGYTRLLVTDGSALPANPGVNPSLTITALAEHTLAQVPPKSGAAGGPHAAASAPGPAAQAAAAAPGAAP